MAYGGSSWHTPHLSSHRGLPYTARLYVIFLQKLPEETRSNIIKKLEEPDKDWTSKFSDNPPDNRILQDVPWIRDHWPSPSDILSIAEQAFGQGMKVNDQYMRSFIFVDSGWDADSAIAARWTTTPDMIGENEQPRMDAVRVPMSIAERLLTLLDLGHITFLREVFDEQQFADAYVDLHAGVERPDFSWPRRPSYEIPEDWPRPLSEGNEKLAVFSLRHLTEGDTRDLRTAIMTDDQAQEAGQTQNVTIYNWPDDKEPPSRSDLWRICKQLRPSIPEDATQAATFFVDNIVLTDDGGPQLVLVLPDSRTRHRTDRAYKPRLEIKPLSNPGMMLPLLRLSKTSSKFEDRAYINNVRLENYNDGDGPLELGQTDDIGCLVFFLSPFTLDEQRAIRTKISEPSDIGGEFAEEYSYLGYLWPESDQSDHTVEDLRDLFEASYPASPFFKSSSHLRITGYPDHFVAVDRRGLDDEPKIILASTLDFGRFNGNQMHSEDELGWQYGTIDAREASGNIANFEIANMGLSECVDDEEVTELWLSDLKEYSEEYRRLKDDPDYDGELPQ